MNYIKSFLFSVAVLVGVLSGALSAQAAQQEVFGWMWSSTVGWASLSSGNDGSGGGNYSVMMNDADGTLSGYAWSSNIGWIKFDPAATGCPNGSCSPQIQLTGPSGERGVVTGWARVCSGYLDKNACSGASRTDGWDGWVHLSDQQFHRSRAGHELGVYFASSTGVVEGFSWGSTNVGWNRVYASLDPSGVNLEFNVSCLNNPAFITGTYRPRWSASVQNTSGNATTFSYAWSWGRTGTSTLAEPHVYRSNNTIGTGQTWTGPRLTVTSSATGNQESVNCPSVSRSGSSGSGFSLYCTALPNQQVGNNYYPRWQAAVSGTTGHVEYTWTLPMSSTYAGSGSGPTFYASTAIPSGSSWTGPTVEIEDDAGNRTSRQCESATNAGADLDLVLGINNNMDDLADGKTSIRVKQNDPAYTYIEYSGIDKSSCIINPTLLNKSGLASNDPDALENRSLNTATLGRFNLSIVCGEAGNNSNTREGKAVLEVYTNPRLEEI